MGTSRQPIWLDVVTCRRLGRVPLDRCRECVYLVRLEGATLRNDGVGDVICAGDDPQLEFDFAW